MNKTKRHQKGFSLIEIMVALVISLILLSGLIEVYLGNKQSYNLIEETSRMQENGRFAIDIMTREIRGADFWGCLRKPSEQNPPKLFNSLNVTAGNAAQYDIGEAITGIDGGGTLPDSISFGGAYGRGISITQEMTQEAAVIMVNANNGLDQNDIIILSDCEKGDIFQINNANPDASGTVVHNTGAPSDGPGNKSTANCTGPGANPHCLSKMYGEDAQIYEVRRIGYAIRPSLFTGVNGLVRIGNDGVATEIIDNVENMQILYGEDTDLDINNMPNQYVTATQIGYVDNANPGRIGEAITVRIALLLRGERDLLPANTAQNHQLLDVNVATNDRRAYQVFTTTITIRNRAINDAPP